MAFSNKVRLFAVPPNVCSFGTLGVDIPIEDGVIAAQSTEVVKACLESQFQEITNQRDLSKAYVVMAARVFDEAYKREMDNGRTEQVARMHAELAVSAAGFADELLAMSGKQESETEPEPASPPPPQVKKPRVSSRVA